MPHDFQFMVIDKILPGGGNMKLKIKLLAVILGIIFFIAIAKFSGFLSLENINCGVTTYGHSYWNNNVLVYTSVIGGSQLCGGESSSPRAGTTFTSDHHYAGGWNNAPRIEWEIPSETDDNVNYPPAEFVAAYPTPEEAAQHMTCKVSGSVVKFGNYWGDVANVNIPYDNIFGEVKWLDSNRGFACIVDVPQFTSPISQGTPVIAGNVEFTLTLPSAEQQETPASSINLNIIMYSIIAVLIVLISFFLQRRK